MLFSTDTLEDTAAFIAHLRDNWLIPHTGVLRFLGTDDNVARIYNFLDDPHLLAQSNMAALEHVLEGKAGFDAERLDVTCLDADGNPTAALTALCDVYNSLEDDAILDDCDYCDRRFAEAQATCEEFYAEDVFADWRAGKLDFEADYGRDAGVVAADAQPDATCLAELTGDAHAFVFGHCMDRAMDDID